MGLVVLSVSEQQRIRYKTKVSLFHMHTWARIHTEENTCMMYLWSMCLQGSP